ncbi:Hypothetical predicted protein [Mytilus galloprovincialis]|uniref:Uncharacterized protein n=1 Tax=Mytilus galloprovincialis TaxID=29158 RepID=A0A8B6C461_MYTGA|nr:Hypothetical predicted protein [Mytilus galloprovincialis]
MIGEKEMRTKDYKALVITIEDYRLPVVESTKCKKTQQLRTLKERSDAHFNRIHNDLSSTDSYKFQRKSCEDQFKFNQKVSVALKEAEAVIEPKDPSAARAKQKISEGIELLNYRQKLVKDGRLFRMWVGNWIRSYTANLLADDSEDDRKIFRDKTERKGRSKQTE